MLASPLRPEVFKTNLGYADGLCPFGGFLFYCRYKFYGRSKHAAAENNFFRVEDADEIRYCHSPEFDTLLNHTNGQCIIFFKGIKHFDGQ